MAGRPARQVRIPSLIRASVEDRCADIELVFAATPFETPSRCLRWLLRACTLALLVATSVQAWDPERMVRAAARYGPQAVQGAQALEQVMASVAGRDEISQLQAVNDFFNQRLAYKEDIDNWGVPDYWASPLEALGKGAGDCEDYAIAKYFTLAALGVPHSRLRLVYVRAASPGARRGYVAHMVLAWYETPDAMPLVLDNLVGAIRPASQRPDLTPVFSFNAEGLWQGVGSIRAEGDPLARLSRWRGVLAKARQDGFQ
jgi:predicted transglutaminase-like cysteine proteinase